MNRILSRTGENGLYYIETYGCQMNERDSQIAAGYFETFGLKPTDSAQNADVILFNACCVRDHAERKLFGNVGFTRMIKEERPNVIIGVCGCMMQQEGMGQKVLKRFPFVDMVFGTNKMHRLPEMLMRVDRGERVLLVDGDETVVEDLPSVRPAGQSAFMNISYGCNNFCSYCIVPYVRGRERSRRPEDIAKEFIELAKAGYSEVTLLGQNVNSYGVGLQEPCSFAALLKMLDGLEEAKSIRRIHFMTSHPKDLSQELMDAMARLDRVYRHIHLPVQSGSNRILEEMNRRYTREQYFALVDRLRETVPGIELTTDIIVGFPGETEEDFLDTMDLVERVGYSSAYTFRYSPREGTRAAGMPDQVPEDVKSDRLYRLNDLQKRKTEECNRKYLGFTGDVLVEGAGERNGESYAFGKFNNFKMAYFPGDASLIGKYRTVRVTDVKNNSLYGVMEEN